MDDGADVVVVEDGRFVWIKHTYEYSKLTEISTVWKSRIVQNEVCTRGKHSTILISKSNVQKTHFRFPDVYARQDFHSRILMRDSSGLEDFKRYPSSCCTHNA